MVRRAAHHDEAGDLESATQPVYNRADTMNPRPALLACAFAAGCFNPTSSDSTVSSTDDTAATNAVTSDIASGSDSTAVTAATSSSADSTAVTVSTSLSMTTTGGDGCGDGLLEPQSEECDDGNLVEGDKCSSLCTKEWRTVFITSDVFTGDLGGLKGADQTCQSAADDAGLSGVFRAWLSTPDSSPVEVFVHSSVPYRDVDGTEIAADWEDLIDGTLLNGITVSELGLPPDVGNDDCGVMGAHFAWTNTLSDGLIFTVFNDCNGWTGHGLGVGGWVKQVNLSWTQGCSQLDCATSTANLYCFEQ